MDAMKPVISLSTSYLQRSFGADGYAMLEATAALGYEYVEISHSTPISAVGGILKAVEDGVVKVSSTHNFCPLRHRSRAGPLFAVNRFGQRVFTVAEAH